MTQAPTVEEYIIAKLSIEDFGRRIRGLARGLWNGSIDEFTFHDSMLSAIERGFEQAWSEGARSEGVSPSERTSEEVSELNRMVFAQAPHLPGLALWISTHSKANDFKLETVLNRVVPWVNRYNEVLNAAKLLAGEDFKEVWNLGPTEHCSSCLSVAGKVKRKSRWRAAGWRPQMRTLECGGFHCQCFFTRSDLPATPGPLPRI